MQDSLRINTWDLRELGGVVAEGSGLALTAPGRNSGLQGITARSPGCRQTLHDAPGKEAAEGHPYHYQIPRYGARGGEPTETPVLWVCPHRNGLSAAIG